MSDDNPNAPPKQANPFAGPPVVDQGAAEQGLWRDGRILVMHKLAQMPSRCVKGVHPTYLEELPVWPGYES